MKNTALLLIAFVMTLSASSQPSVVWTPFIHQTGMYYSSDRVTSYGYGMGLGTCYKYRDHLVAQVDINLLWGNGNAVTTRIAAGYQKKGLWTPSISGTVNLLWGHRTEILSESGERPPTPVWVLGICVVPLRFETKKGFISALEFGYGFGPNHGRSIEASILSIGFKF